MSNKKLYILWGALAVLCAVISFVPEQEGALSGFMALLAVAFFVPPSVLLYRGIKSKNEKLVALIRIISLSSLVATLVLLVVNFLSVGASRVAGDVLYGLLIIVSVPMVCSQIWGLSLFAWAVLLILGYKHKKMK